MLTLLSCLGADAYREVGYTHDWEELRAVGVACADRLFRLPAEQVMRAPPSIIGVSGRSDPEHVIGYFQHLNDRFDVVLPIDLVRLECSVVGGRVLYQPCASGGAVVLETFREIDRKYVTLSAAALAGDFTRAERVEESAGYVGSAGSANYGHWLVDDLPRILHLVDHAAECRLLILPGAGARVDAVKTEIIAELIDDPPAIRFVGEDELLVCRDLCYVTPCSFHPTTKSRPLLQALRVRLQAKSAAPAAPRERISVTRSADSGRRRLTNRDAVAELLADDGFVTCDPAALGGMEQLRAFEAAATVVGVMGAEMTNTVAAPIGCAAVYLAPQGWLEPFYWDLAHTMGHDYSCVFGAPDAATDAPHEADFRIDLRSLERVLTAARPAGAA